MALGHCDLQDVPGGIGYSQAILYLYIMDCFFGDDLLGDYLDDLCPAPLGLNPEVLGGDL